jgi:dsDNA-specific endonuclease/ATPase MutS2
MNAIKEYCRKSKVIKSYRPGNFDEGGDGVTIATFKD